MSREARLVLNKAVNHEPQITYLVANYNNGRFIQECLESLYAPINPAWHCLIADDGSTDDSLALIQPLLNHRIELVVNPENLGKSRTLARLIEHSPTDIVGILDPDDALYPEATAAVLAAYAQAPETGFVYTNYANIVLIDKLSLGQENQGRHPLQWLLKQVLLPGKN